MIWVRLIGGLHDGEVAKVDVDQTEIVRRRNIPLPATVSLRRSVQSDSVEVKASRYTHRVVTVSDGEIVYFASDSLSDIESLQHVLGP